MGLAQQLEEARMDESLFGILPWMEKLGKGVEKAFRHLKATVVSKQMGNAGGEVHVTIQKRTIILYTTGTGRYPRSGGPMKLDNSWVLHGGQRIWGGGSVKRSVKALMSAFETEGLT